MQDLIERLRRLAELCRQGNQPVREAIMKRAANDLESGKTVADVRYAMDMLQDYGNSLAVKTAATYVINVLDMVGGAAAKAETWKGTALQALIDEAKPTKLTAEAQNMPYADAIVLGILATQWAQFDERAIYELCFAALEDANMHSEGAALEAVARKNGVLDD